MQDVYGRQALHSFRTKRYKTTLRFLDKRKKFGYEDRGFAEVRGWSLLKRGKRKSALRIFTKLNKARSTRASRRAIRVAKKSW